MKNIKLFNSFDKINESKEEKKAEVKTYKKSNFIKFTKDLEKWEKESGKKVTIDLFEGAYKEAKKFWDLYVARDKELTVVFKEKDLFLILHKAGDKSKDSISHAYDYKGKQLSYSHYSECI